MMSAGLLRLELLKLTTVLDDCADQLAILGHVMPDKYRGRTVADMVVTADIGEMLEEQRGAEQKLKSARQRQGEGGGGSLVLDATRSLHRSHKELNRALEENPLSPDNLAKVQRDRQFVAQVITNVLVELKERGTFHSLLQAVADEKKRKACLSDIIIREAEGCRRTKALQKQLVDIRKERTLELQRRDEMTAHLKDQLQELRAKTGQEKKYVKSSAELVVYQTRKLNHLSEKELEDEIMLLHKRLEEERRVHLETETFLKKQQTLLEEKLELWMVRYERDIEEKQQELNSLKNNKANNLSRLQDLAKKYRESEQVVIEDRVEKENLRRHLDREQTERNAAIKIQAWWRGTLVRRGLGSFKNGKKAKEGKKKGKKKKK